MRASVVFAFAALLGCKGEPQAAAAHLSSSGGNVATPVADTPVVNAQSVDTGGHPVIRALYLNRFAPQSARKMRRLFAIADSTEINGFVVDMKDEFGLNYRSSNPKLAKNAGGTHGFVGNVRALVDSMKAHGVVPIARIVAFKDPVAARENPDWTIRREDGSIWQDKEGLAWVNAHNRDVWEYNLLVAEELVRLGFEEIQWDYIRFPEPYRSLPKQVFPGATLSKPEALKAFLTLAQERLSKVGVRNTADVFGLVTTVRGPLEVGQWWEKLSPHVDVILPMVYPSHYPRGSFRIAHPNSEPYNVLKIALDTARVRDERLGIKKAEHVRPWIQAFTLGKPPYGPEQISAQKQAIYDAGFKGWVLWSPGSMYDAFVPALERQKP
ncbi:MAG: putative glycoside hydrolase [Gemmatimonadaceae bacterium]